MSQMQSPANYSMIKKANGASLSQDCKDKCAIQVTGNIAEALTGYRRGNESREAQTISNVRDMDATERDVVVCTVLGKHWTCCIEWGREEGLDFDNLSSTCLPS